MNRYAVVQYDPETSADWLMCDQIFDSVLEASKYAQNYCKIKREVPWEVVELKELD